MELGQLRALRELGERGSITAVAAALRVTPSSISQQISALQRTARAPLTRKDGRRTVLTDAGRALAAAAIDVEVALGRAERAVADFTHRPAGPVSVAAFHSVGLALFGPLLMSLDSPEQPEVALTDFDVAQEDFATLTSEHDLVIAHRLLGSPRWPRSVRAEPLMVEPLDLAMRRDHPLASEGAIDPADLGGEDWVAVHEGFPLESAVTTIAGLAGTEPNIRHRINDFAIASSVVEASGGVALLPRYTTDLRRHPGIVLRALSGIRIRRHIDCLARPETLERTSVQIVLERLRQLARSLADRADGTVGTP